MDKLALSFRIRVTEFRQGQIDRLFALRAAGNRLGEFHISHASREIRELNGRLMANGVHKIRLHAPAPRLGSRNGNLFERLPRPGFRFPTGAFNAVLDKVVVQHTFRAVKPNAYALSETRDTAQ